MVWQRQSVFDAEQHQCSADLVKEQDCLTVVCSFIYIALCKTDQGKQLKYGLPIRAVFSFRVLEQID